MYPTLKTTILIGPPGSGKSHFIHRYIQTILDDPKDQSQWVLIDPKRTELSVFKQSKKTLAYIHSQIEQAFDASTLQELQTRFLNLQEGRSNQHLSKIYFIFDEFRDAFTLNQTKSIRALTKLMNQKERLNIEFVMSSQSEEALKPFMKYANTVIRFTNHSKSITKETLDPKFRDYDDFRCLGLSGHAIKIKEFISEYRRVIPTQSLVYDLGHGSQNKVLMQIEELIEKRMSLKGNLLKEPRIVAFINLKGKWMNQLTLIARISKMLIHAEKARLTIVLSTDQSRYPLSITKDLNSLIKFS